MLEKDDGRQSSSQNSLPFPTYAVLLKINVEFNIRPSQVLGESEPQHFGFTALSRSTVPWFSGCLQNVNQGRKALRTQPCFCRGAESPQG